MHSHVTLRPTLLHPKNAFTMEITTDTPVLLWPLVAACSIGLTEDGFRDELSYSVKDKKEKTIAKRNLARVKTMPNEINPLVTYSRGSSYRRDGSYIYDKMSKPSQTYQTL